jgi:hypothetical protein
MPIRLNDWNEAQRWNGLNDWNVWNHGNLWNCPALPIACCLMPVAYQVA